MEEFKIRYREGKIGDIQVKRRLAEALNETLAPLRQRRAEWIRRPDDLIDILRAGTRRARPIAQATFEEVEKKMGLINTGD